MRYNNNHNNNNTSSSTSSSPRTAYGKTPLGVDTTTSSSLSSSSSSLLRTSPPSSPYESYASVLPAIEESTTMTTSAAASQTSFPDATRSSSSSSSSLSTGTYSRSSSSSYYTSTLPTTSSSLPSLRMLQVRYAEATQQVVELQRQLHDACTQHERDRERLLEDKAILYQQLKELLCWQEVACRELRQRVVQLEQKRKVYRRIIAVLSLLVLGLLYCNNGEGNSRQSSSSRQRGGRAPSGRHSYSSPSTIAATGGGTTTTTSHRATDTLSSSWTWWGSLVCAPVRPGRQIRRYHHHKRFQSPKRYTAPWWWPHASTRDLVFDSLCAGSYPEFEIQWNDHGLQIQQIPSFRQTTTSLMSFQEPSCRALTIGLDHLTIVTTRGRTKEIPVPWRPTTTTTTTTTTPVTVLGVPVAMG